ncbi:MAG: putative TIM-barrel fold metal-dependent hydrolase [Neobacillus sp.]|jgi:predicted TIM-barrel fold metal-dependent hydrolase|nr:putative TIM-barrel fold metal-dependent hydrolase [Neobacillus sp.]
MIIDGHAHIAEMPYISVDKLRKTMKEANIDRTVLFPGGMVDVRKMTNYVIGKDKPEKPEANNDYVLSLVKEYPELYYGFCNVNVNNKSEKVLEQLEYYIKQGLHGLKMAPMVHQFSLLGKTSKALADLCGQLDIPFYTHTIFPASASTSAVGKLASEFKDTTFIIGHMGFGPMDIEAIELSSSMENVYLETSSANYLAIETAVEKCGHEKVIYGSEFPLSDPYVEKVKIERLPISDDKKDYIFSKNILRLMKSEVGVG